MPLHGDLRTMSIEDLLRWVASNRATGVLELERHKICRRVEFRTGWIGACSSSDPASRLGQFLISRGKLDEETLRKALERQRETRKNLGRVLLDMNVLRRKELSRLISTKAEETMYGLFEWNDAVFRFNLGATLDPDHIEVNISVGEMIEKGRRRLEELRDIRAVFPSSGIVLSLDDRAAALPALQRPIARRVTESIDGTRTIAEVLLHTRASHFTVLKFLWQLQQKGLAVVAETREPGETPTLLDVEASAPKAAPWNADEFSREVVDELETPAGIEADSEPKIPQTAFEPRPASVELDDEIRVAIQLLDRSEYDAALELLNASYRAHPQHDYLRQLLGSAEQSYVTQARRQALAFDRIPSLNEIKPGVRRPGLRPEDSFLMSVIDGRLDIQSILWITPLREIDVLMALRRLLDAELITLDRDTTTSADECAIPVCKPLQG